MKTVNSSNLPLIDYRKLKHFQGELKFLSKDNYNKLLLSIEKNGFFVPMFIWFSEGEAYVLDAHQRLRVLNNEGIEFDNTGFEVPYVEIEAKDKKEAASKLLVLSSQYGTITQEGIDEFIATFELPEMEIKELTNFDGIFEFPLLPPEPQNLEVEPELDVEVDSQDGVLYALGPHRVMCGDPREAEIAPEKMDAYRKKYQRIMTGSEDGWQSATPSVDEESE